MLNSQTSDSAKRDPAGEHGAGYFRRDYARDQEHHADVPEPVQHEKGPERFRALAFAYRRPNILRGNNAPEEKTECSGDVLNERDRHDALLSSPRASRRQGGSRLHDAAMCRRDSGVFRFLRASCRDTPKAGAGAGPHIGCHRLLQQFAVIILSVHIPS